MTAITLDNLQGWVSTEWDSAQAKKDADLTQLRAKEVGAST